MWELTELAGGAVIVLMPLFLLTVPVAVLVLVPLAIVAAATLLLAAPLLALRSLAR